MRTDIKLRALALSIIVLLPVFWHKHIEAGDLASHTYNAWLAQLVRAGQAPGLSLVHRTNNVLFDWILDAATRLLGFASGERLAVSIAVLIFFWGGFSLVYAVAGHRAWRAVPLLLMFTYGWTFHMGFFNYYLGVGLAFFALAACFYDVRKGCIVTCALLPLVWLAHPISAALLLGLASYMIAAKLLPRKLQVVIFGACFVILIAARMYLFSHFYCLDGDPDPLFLNGTDQIVLFGTRYAVLAYALVALILSAFVMDAVTHKNVEELVIPVQLYLLSFLAALWLPDIIMLPGYLAPLSFVTVRLTVVCSVLSAVLFAIIRPRAWHTAILALITVLFFSFVYQDTGAFSQTEDNVSRLVRSGQKVIGFLPAKRESRISAMHIIDRACVERCFSFENYEPASEQFRMHAAAGNKIVTARIEDSAMMQIGRYVVQPNDLPVVSVYHCGPDLIEVCSRTLIAGDSSGRTAFAP